jgi:ATP-dependent DNA helicase PIF1
VTDQVYTTQKEVLGAIIKGESVFVTGPAGTGKSHIINRVRKELPGVAVTASTGIAARNISGQTLHRWCGLRDSRAFDNPDIPWDRASEQVANSVINGRYFDEKADAIAETRTLIIDEVSMLSGPFLNAVDKICQAARGDDRPFGGIQVVLVGDLFQLPPVSRYRPALPCFHADIFKDPLFKKANLQQIYRQSDPVFISALNNIRLGRVTQTVNDLFLERQTHKAVKSKRPVVLASTNKETDRYNKKCLGDEPGDIVNFAMRGVGERMHQEKLLDQILPPENLELKVNARVMATLNNPDLGYCNGSLGWVKGVGPEAIKVLFDETTEPVEIKRHKWTTLSDEERQEMERTRGAGGSPDYPWDYAEVSQFPLILGYAMTIHKSQGLTFEQAYINLSAVFEAGQAYVALSRVKSLDGLYLRGWEPRKIKAPPDALAFMKSAFGDQALPQTPHIGPTPLPVAAPATHSPTQSVAH